LTGNFVEMDGSIVPRETYAIPGTLVQRTEYALNGSVSQLGVG
jgi:hypothetical protein